MKLRKKERIPKAIAKSLLKKIKIIKVKIPVKKLVKAFYSEIIIYVFVNICKNFKFTFIFYYFNNL